MKCLVVINVLFSMDPVVKIHHDPFFSGQKKLLFNLGPVDQSWMVGEKRRRHFAAIFWRLFNSPSFPGDYGPTATLGKIPPKKTLPPTFTPQNSKEIPKQRPSTHLQFSRDFFCPTKPLGWKIFPPHETEFLLWWVRGPGVSCGYLPSRGSGAGIWRTTL